MSPIVEPAGQAHPIGAGASMSPGNQILALTANNASTNSTTIKAGNNVERKKANAVELVGAFCSSGSWSS